MSTNLEESLTPEWDQRVRGELESDERLIWASQPLEVSAGRTMRDALPYMLFGLLWLGFTVFGYTMWQKSRADRKQFDDNFEKNFQDEFFREARERRRKEAEGVSMFDVVPLVIAGGAGLVGIGLLLSPLWMMRSRKKRQAQSCYALTSRRALVWEPVSQGLQLHTYGPSQLERLKRIERQDGSGDLVFEEWTYTYEVRIGDGSGGTRTETRQGLGQRGFMNVGGVREIERLLKQTLLN